MSSKQIQGRIKKPSSWEKTQGVVTLRRTSLLSRPADLALRDKWKRTPGAHDTMAKDGNAHPTTHTDNVSC